MLAVQDTVAVPEPIKVVGVIGPQVSPDGTASDRLTILLKWFSAAMVIVEVAN